MKIWKEIKGVDGWYDVSSDGEVRSWKKGSTGNRREEPRILSTKMSNSGVIVIDLQNGVDDSGNIVRNRYTLGRLMWETFNSKVPQGFKVVSIDGNKFNMKLSNLKIRSNSDIGHEYKHKNKASIPKGEDSKHSILTEDNVREIRRRYNPKTSHLRNRGEGGYLFAVDDSPDSRKALAKEFGVSIGAIWDAYHNRSWDHLDKTDESN